VVALIAFRLVSLGQTLQLHSSQQQYQEALRQGGHQPNERGQGHLMFEN
jgi:hypothetical protein